jgi:CDP-diglyceride synthetase
MSSGREKISAPKPAGTWLGVILGAFVIAVAIAVLAWPQHPHAVAPID